ncbi:hypothetical protein, variant 1 [Aphanomyces astaci]|uniref:Uncharacterized protein n=1 Tax=Aphanomyces astaci TaxID=112090 RepID=W4FWU4_APHAT|nr:hypothetical protein, variant 1 [Aphanomyces astaci]ETV71962.1 hypothetical protein, variant 1 [Aphanomyces astaci]|eukprot:XP_009838405.1 hypothetical protein, variant 1 [Aphanomyces astaci]
MDEFADLKDGSGEWQNIQSVLRSTFQVLLESKVRQERRVAQLEQKMEELQLQVDQKADKAYVQRSIIQPHVPSSDYDTNNPSTSSGVNSTAKTVQVMQRQLIELEARFAAMSSVLLSNCPLYSMPIYVQCENERIIIGQDSELCLATERRVEYVEEELRLIVPIIDKKADVEAIHLWLGQANDSWKHAMKKRLKTTSFEREVQNWQAKLDQVECAGSLEHPDTKAQLHQLSSKLHQHEATLARLAYFIQKSPDQQVAIQNSMADLETKLQNTIVMIQAKQHINNDVLSPAGELGEPNDKLETTGSIAAMATKIQALETQVETVAQRGVATSSDQENLARVEQKVHQLTEILHGFVSDVQIELEHMQHKTDSVNQLDQRIHHVDAKVCQVNTTVQELISAMSLLANHLPDPSLSPPSPAEPPVLLGDETAQLVELEALLASSLQSHDKMILGPQSQLELVRDQLSATLNDSSTSSLRGLHQMMLHPVSQPSDGVSHALAATLAHLNHDQSQRAVEAP